MDTDQNVLKIRLDLRPLQSCHSLEFNDPGPITSVTEIVIEVDCFNLSLEAKHTFRRAGHSVIKEFMGNYILPGYTDEKTWRCYRDETDTFIVEARIRHNLNEEELAPQFTARLLWMDPESERFQEKSSKDQNQTCYHYTDSRRKELDHTDNIDWENIELSKHEPLKNHTFVFNDFVDTRERDFREKLSKFREELARVRGDTHCESGVRRVCVDLKTSSSQKQSVLTDNRHKIIQIEEEFFDRKF